MIKKIGIGEFGDIYEGVTGQEAVDFLLQNGSGEVFAALYNKETQIFVDIIYGKGGENGYGLIHIKEKHPECVLNLEEIVKKNWLLTTFIT